MENQEHSKKPIDIRLFSLPDRMEVIDLLDGKVSSLSSMQFWEVEDGPVVIEPNGESKIYMQGDWRGMDAWEAALLPLNYARNALKLQHLL